jgi:aspartyl/glutamyl-tRNA(Asn/Gln) amidotransferase C subunit
LISVEETIETARLAGLELADTGVSEMAAQLSSILAWMGKIDGADISGVEPMLHPVQTDTPMRKDIPGGNPPGEATECPPDREGPFPAVPRINGG